MGIILLNSGVLTTIQDRGRMGHQRFGFHVAGAMDKRAYEFSNALVDNYSDEAVIEFAIMGPTIKFTSDTVIAITGGDFSPTINDEEVRMYSAIQVHAGDILKFSFCKDGVWGYVSFAGGLDVPLVMGSRSTDIKSELGGLEGRKLANNDTLEFLKNISSLPAMEKRVCAKPTYKKEVTDIRVVLGPQDDYFSEAGLNSFLFSEYTVTSQCDRMGYRLDGEPIEHNELGADIISDGIAYGSIQVPSQGLPIVLLSDRQTTGGYTKIATVIGHDIPSFVQRRPGERVHFVAVTPDEAQVLYRNEFEEFEALKNSIASAKNKGLFARLFKK